MHFPCRLHVALFLLFSLWERPSAAQSYAPETEYHDVVQRLYVPEAARIVGWLAERHATNFTEITYNVVTKADGTTTWQLAWLDVNGKPAKACALSYPKTLLNSGPQFYRFVFNEIWNAGWKGLMPVPAEDARAAFWRGAEEAGPSREHGLESALALVPRGKITNWTFAPELAGILSHTTLPGIADRLTIDDLLLARAAAWLVISEKMSASELDDLWPPILFQARRERVASELWIKTHAASLTGVSAAQEGWNIWLRSPTSKESFLFAASSTNLGLATAMLTYDAVINDTGSLFAELLPDLCGTTARLRSLHNYLPFMAVSTTIGGGHILNGQGPRLQRTAWLELLREMPVTNHDFTGYTNAVQDTMKALEEESKNRRTAPADLSLLQLREFSPLLRFAKKEGVGPLTPVAAVTSRDVLNYGWEMAGLQMSTRYFFVNSHWGIPDLGERIYNEVNTDVDGLMPFFKSDRKAKIDSYKNLLQRLQMVEGFQHRVGFSDHPFGPKSSDLPGAQLFVKRFWLRPADFEWQARTLWDADAGDQVPDLVDALAREAGALGAVHVLHYYDSIDESEFKNVPRGQEQKTFLAEKLPQPSMLYVRCLYQSKFAHLNNFERAQEIEKLFWRNPDFSGLEDRVFRGYAAACAYKSATRFYKQARPFFNDPVSFSATTGKKAWVVGWCIGDEELCRMALEDSRSASYSDMMMAMWDAAAHEKWPALKEAVEKLVNRYETENGNNSAGRKLLRFMPLIPALKDPKHPEHTEAIRYFGKDDVWIVLRWILIQKLQLSTDDAVTFLGGEENLPLQKLLIYALQKNQTQAREAFDRFNGGRSRIDELTVLGAFVYEQLRSDKQSNDEVDLKPKEVISIRAAVAQKLSERR